MYVINRFPSLRLLIGIRYKFLRLHRLRSIFCSITLLCFITSRTVGMGEGLSILVLHHITGGLFVLYGVYINTWVGSENRRTLLTPIGQYANSHQPCYGCSSHGNWYTSAISKLNTNVATVVFECGIRWQVHSLSVAQSGDDAATKGTAWINQNGATWPLASTRQRGVYDTY